MRRGIRVEKGTSLRKASEVLDAQPKWTIGVFATIFNQSGEILLVREKGKKGWSLPGGGLEIEDQVNAAESGLSAFAVGLSREISQETGMRVIAVETDICCPQLGTRMQDCALGFFVRAEGDPVPMSEIEEVRWVSMAELSRFPLVGPRIQEIVFWGFRIKSSFGS